MYRKRTPEIEAKARLIVDGWNGGLTGGELAALHRTTRSAVMGVIHREKSRGIKVEERGRLVMKVRVAKAQAKQAGLGRVSGFPDTRRNKPEPSMPPIVVTAGQGVNHETRHKLQTIRNLPALIVVAQKPGKRVAEPSALWVDFMDLQNNAGCRYSLDAKVFCNAPGYPYCPEHKAIVNPASAQVSHKRRQKSAGRWL